MNKLLFLFLHIIDRYNRLKRWISGKSETDIADEELVSGKVWADFCDELKSAGASLRFPGAPTDAFQQAEGVRYLSRLTRAALQAYVEFSDPAFPELRRMVDETIKLGADNPDNYYLNAQISGDYEYRIRGKRNTIHYLGFFTQNGNYGSTGGLAPCGVLEGEDLIMEADGTFEIMLSHEKKGKNWLKIEPDTSLLMIRQTFLDRNSEQAIEAQIETVNGPDKPAQLNSLQMKERLKTASMFVGGASLLFSKWVRGFKAHSNQLPLFDPSISNAAGGDKNILYYHSHWRLEDDEHLLIEVYPPECDSWNFQLNNYWMESLDYRYYNVCINQFSAIYESDGKVKVYVGAEDPGHPNWISTAAHREGTMCWRWYRSKDQSTAPEPHCQVVKLNQS